MDDLDITPTPVEIIDPKQQRLAVLAEDTRTRMKRSALDIYHIGANLLEAQNLLAHGEFLPWIQAEFDMSQRSAYKFMNVAKAFQGKFAQNANLEISASALYLLASPDTPDDARNEALELAAAGEPISPKKAKKLIEKHTSTATETAALGEALGLPTRGDSVLPKSDRIDDLTHSSPADVDDRLGAPSPQLYRHQVGEIVFVSNQPKMPFEQRMWSRWWGVVKSVGDVSVTVSFGQREEKFMALDLIRHEQLSSQFRETCQKILNLWQEEVEPMEAIILRELQHKEAFTPWEIQLISWMESQHINLN